MHGMLPMSMLIGQICTTSARPNCCNIKSRLISYPDSLKWVTLLSHYGGHLLHAGTLIDSFHSYCGLFEATIYSSYTLILSGQKKITLNIAASCAGQKTRTHMHTHTHTKRRGRGRENEREMNLTEKYIYSSRSEQFEWVK